MIITKKLVPTNKRTNHTAQLFGLHFPMHLEPAVYGLTDNLSEDYKGGYWDFWELSNDGFYMSPNSDKIFRVTTMNGYEGYMSGDALGLTACIYAYSHLSFGPESRFTDDCARHFHLLRDYALDHIEGLAIMMAID